MTRPKSLEIDLENGVAYVRYNDEPVAQTVDVCDEGYVAADLDMKGNVTGIELLGLDDETVERARTFAHERGIAFPKTFNGVIGAA